MKGRTTHKQRTPFGERLAAARLAAGLSQIALAEKLGVDRTVVRHNERKVSDPKLNFVLRCCAALRVSIDELIDAPHAFKSPRGVLVARLVNELRKLSRQQQYAVLRIALATIPEFEKIKPRKGRDGI